MIKTVNSKLNDKNQAIIAGCILLALMFLIFFIGSIWTNLIVLVGSIILYLCSVTQRGDETINVSGILSLSFIILSEANLIKDIIKEYELSHTGIFYVLIFFLIPMVVFFLILLLAYLLKRHTDKKNKSQK
ncbi:hypothetical protein [Providencia alcalifaciens]|uniref:hypothetical protein n=1 Tax=Providencia alcalifaciens TaxID=126385 RepID=UPI003D2C923B